MLDATATVSVLVAVREPEQVMAAAIWTTPARVGVALTAAEAWMAVERAADSAFPAVSVAVEAIPLARAPDSVLVALSREDAVTDEASADASLLVASASWTLGRW